MAFETILTSEMMAACNGGGGALGHPKVYLNLAPHGRVECPYCSRLFVNRAMPMASVGESVATPSAHGPGVAGNSEHPPPRQPEARNA